jgi:hypothetical protein
MGYHSHSTTPQSTVPSPGATSINSVHEDYPDINSPGWPRTPASPVSNLIFFNIQEIVVICIFINNEITFNNFLDNLYIFMGLLNLYIIMYRLIKYVQSM